MSMSPPGYDPEADYAATGKVLCDDCGTRLRPQTLATLPDHGCGSIQLANRELLALVVQGRVFRDVTGDVQVWTASLPQDRCEPVDYAALHRLEQAGFVALRDSGVREPGYEMTARALRGT